MARDTGIVWPSFGVERWQRRVSRWEITSVGIQKPVGSGARSKVITSEIEFKGYKVHASKDEPQYEIKSDKTDHIAMHKGSALTKVSA